MASPSSFICAEPEGAVPPPPRVTVIETKAPQQPQQQQEQQQAPKSFYQRPLPQSCIALSSKEGKKIFASALSNGGLRSFFALIEQFTTQAEPGYCGVSTLVLVLNALSVDPQQTWKGPWRWYEERMLNCCVDLEEMKEKGITLSDFQCLARCQGLSVDMRYCDESTTVDDFRQAVNRACAETDSEDEGEHEKSKLELLVVSYSRAVLGQTGSGHFSPVAAYDSTSDKVLILDTARFKYGPHWVKLPTVFEAMQPNDPTTGRSRGFALLSFRPLPLSQGDLETQPVSLLFRAKMSQNDMRRIYKDWLLERKDAGISWEDVLKYWTKNGTDSGFIWQVLDRLQLRADVNRVQMQLVNLIRALIEPTKVPTLTSKCNANGRCFVHHQDAIFIFYLASLDPSRREEIVASPKAAAFGDKIKSQLLCEAQLVASAIEISDQISLNK